VLLTPRRQHFVRPRIGIVGLNHGYVLALKAKALHSVELVSVCARNPNQHRVKATELGVSLFGTVESMLGAAPLDGVIVAVPTSELVKVAESCLQRGVAVLIEKPSGCNVAEALRLKRVAAELCGTVVVGYHRRLSRQVVELRRVLASKAIGEVRGIACKWVVKKPDGYFKSWRALRVYGGGCLMINAVHEIDTLQHLFGPITLVGAIENSRLVAPASDVEHFVVLTMKFETGQVATAVFSDQCPSPHSYENTVTAGTPFPQYSEDCYHFFGSLGCLAFPSFSVRMGHQRVPSWLGTLSKSILSDANAAIDDPLTREIDHFSRVLTDQALPHATVDDAIRNLAVVEAIRRSLSSSALESVEIIPKSEAIGGLNARAS
jgi:predicted dehydrogenase